MARRPKVTCGLIRFKNPVEHLDCAHVEKQKFTRVSFVDHVFSYVKPIESPFETVAVDDHV